MPNDPFSDDPFFGDAPTYGGEHVNAFELDQQGEWLRDQGYDTGDPITLTWTDADGEVRQTEIPLPRGDWDKAETWSDFYDEMRDFYEEAWGEGGYEGEANAG